MQHSGKIAQNKKFSSLMYCQNNPLPKNIEKFFFVLTKKLTGFSKNERKQGKKTTSEEFLNIEMLVVRSIGGFFLVGENYVNYPGNIEHLKINDLGKVV